MRRHELDWVSALAGALFVLVAVGYLVAELTGERLDPDWVLPLLLVGLGVVGLAGSIRGGRGRERAEAETAEPAEPADADEAAEPTDSDEPAEPTERLD